MPDAAPPSAPPVRAAVAACLALASLLAPVAAAQTRYLAFGDSITAGVGDESGQGYAPRLEALLQGMDPGSTVESSGVPGETTAEGLSRIDGELDGPPGVLLLLEGTNDVSRRISSETTVFNLEEMARKAGAAGWEVLHATVIPRRPEQASARDVQLNETLNRRLRASVGTRGLDLADPFEVFGSTPDLFARFYTDDADDPVGHPNGDGYQLLAGIFRDVLAGIDAVPPVTGPVRPASARDDVPPDSSIEVDLWDFGAGIDTLNTVLLVDGAEVPAQISGGGRHARLVYQPPDPLSGEVVVHLRSRDLASPVNTVDREISRFLVEGSAPSGPVEGDLDGSGRVDGVDLVRFAVRFGAVQGDARYAAEADFDGDGVIDGEDLAVLAASFGREV
ncbi:MAG: GDSL-type esterase/lipase family protein [Acidobacteriota bacterium]